MKTLRGGFLGIGNSAFRAFTAAPAIEYAVSLAHRMARRHLESGGATTPTANPATRSATPADFIIPADVDAHELVKAIERHLAQRGSEPTADAPPLLKRKAGGRIVVPGHHLLRIGDGRFDKGRAYLHGLVRHFRKQRWRTRFTARK